MYVWIIVYIIYVQYILAPIGDTVTVICNGLLTSIMSQIRLELRYLISKDFKKCSEFN